MAIPSFPISWTPEERARHVEWLAQALSEACNERAVFAKISIKTCGEIIDRFHHDIERLLQGKNAGQIHPAKYIGYLCFWLRKLKPISQAFPRAAVEKGDLEYNISYGDEVIDINERVTISIIVLLLFTFCEREAIPEFAGCGTEVALKSLESAVAQFFSMKSDVGSGEGTILAALLYDMRYRTFGPHHLVHTCYSILSYASFLNASGT